MNLGPTSGTRNSEILENLRINDTALFGIQKPASVKKASASTLFRCVKTVSEPLGLGPMEICLSEKQTPQVIVFSRKLSEKGERLDRAFVRPRQVRYQAALRPDYLIINESWAAARDPHWLTQFQKTWKNRATAANHPDAQ